MRSSASALINLIFGSRLRSALIAVLATAFIVGLGAVQAGAVIVNQTGPDLSYMPLNGAKPSGQAKAGGQAQTAGINLTYHGGPVMPSNTAYAIFWAPSGFTFPAGYTAAITKYLQDVAADTGKSTNHLSVGTQYTDTTGARAGYGSSYGASFTDTTAYPTSGACPAYSSFTSCLTDAQVSSEVDSVINANSLPRGLSNYYFVVLPPNVGSCFGHDDLLGLLPPAVVRLPLLQQHRRDDCLREHPLRAGERGGLRHGPVPERTRQRERRRRPQRAEPRGERGERGPAAERLVRRERQRGR